MTHELTLNIGNSPATMFLQDGFYTLHTLSGNLHRHGYTEFHAIAEGCAHFLIGKEKRLFRDGDIFAIPPNTFHMCLSATDGLHHTAFQADAPVSSFEVRKLSPALIRSFMDEIRLCNQTADHTRIGAFLCLVCCDFYPEHRICPRESRDLEFIIHEFFARRYRDPVTLAELARVLHFSEKHTARLVLKYTGSTFREALTAQRMAVARHLAETTDLSLGEISQYLGYQSYSGFWKAYRKGSDI